MIRQINERQLHVEEEKTHQVTNSSSDKLMKGQTHERTN